MRKLGFAIPTFNREDLIKKTINSIINNNRFSEVCVYISDNSDNLLTMHYMQELQIKYSNIIYHKNDVNIGMDRNIVNAVNNCPSEYVWIMGDDDLLSENCIDKVLTVLEIKEFPFIFANYSYISNDYQYILKNKVLNIHEDRQYIYNEFIKKNLWAMGFIGSCIIRKVDWLTINAEKYIGNAFPHIGIISEYSEMQEIYVISRSCVLNRSENISSTTWGDRAFEIYNGYEKTVKMLRKYYDDKFIADTLDNSKVLFNQHSIAWIMSKRADGVFDKKTWNEQIQYNERYSAIYKSLTLIIASTPKFLYRCIKFFVKTLPTLFNKRKINKEY